ncbi:CRISPR-associated protein Cas4 [Butyricimonas virosa]|jgi:CRISPR-associated exonuclease Cas4|uniref:CRISPR-associated protein Cas4 n=1 Tax=Butyricimonas virosa TaxID=544645 RepID=UPI000E440D9C|nr:CRISPR-associated protein Cas4 [Butyricimonas virosa]MCI6414373.1 CRISPR-associated protein Cas4 [Butyricimonas virosa]RGL85898.1 CRISPR-associated protein Cas4 [Butyricimonas virosa]
MNIIATHINYYCVCKRKLWLFGNGIGMEYTSDLVTEGRLVHETSYPNRAARYEEISIGGSVIDFYDPQTKVIHEIKKSSAKEEAHVWQVKYYIYLFEKEEIMGVKGVLEYPLLREIVSVNFEDEDREELKSMMFEIKKIVEGEMCPPRLLKKRCSQCSYFEFCYAAEECDV